METIISLCTKIVSALFSLLFKKREPTEFDKQYEKFRFNVAESLAMYACYYHNPVDLAQMPEHKLPDKYTAASVELRKLGATASALAATMLKSKKKFPITKADLENVSGCLIGLSNSMHTPYNCAVSADELVFVRDCEAEIRKLLDIEKANS